MTPEQIRRWTDPALRVLRVLVVDDSPENRALVEIYLRASPHQLEFAANGRVAVEKFAVGDFDLVLMDIDMPVMDGHSATRAIRKLEASLGRPRTSIIAISANTSEDVRERSLAAGCDLHLAKPLFKYRLLEILDEYAD